MAKRQQYVVDPEWQQLELQLRFPEQKTYEQVRPVVVWGMPIAERARQIGVPNSTLARAVDRFTAQGMHSIFQPLEAPPPAWPRLPLELQQYLADLKAQHPPLHIYELSTICFIRFGRRPGARAIKRALAEVAPRTTERRFPRFHDTPDPTDTKIKCIVRAWQEKHI